MSSQGSKAAVTFISDEPSREDKLVTKFTKYSSSIASSLKGVDGSITVGLLGGWGSGKTTLMNLLAKDLKAKAGYKGVVHFESWRYEGHPAPTIPLLHAIVNEVLLRSLGQGSDQKVQARKLIEVSAKVAKGILSATKATVGVIEVEPGGIYSAIVDGITDFKTSDLQDLREELIENDAQHFRRALEDILGEDRWAVMIDDLDRCGPDALKILDATKSLLQSKGLTFVIGIDPSPIKSWVRRKYEDLPDHAEMYLDKIINVPVYLPTHNPNWRKELERDWNDTFRDLAPRNTRPNVAYPLPEQCSLRQLKRIINQTILASKLSPSTTVGVLFGLICLRELDNVAFEALRNDPKDMAIRSLVGPGYLANFDVDKVDAEAAAFFNHIRKALLEMGVSGD